MNIGRFRQQGARGLSVVARLARRISRMVPLLVLLMFLCGSILIVVRPGLLLESTTPYSFQLGEPIASLLKTNFAARLPDPLPILLAMGGITVTFALLLTVLANLDSGSTQAAIHVDQRVSGQAPTLTGDSLDELFAESKAPQTPLEKKREQREEFRQIVRETAVRALMQADGCSRDTAIERLAEGNWTDDSRAAVFIGGPNVVSVPLDIRIRDWLHPEPTFHRRASRAVDVLQAYADSNKGQP